MSKERPSDYRKFSTRILYLYSLIVDFKIYHLTTAKSVKIVGGVEEDKTVQITTMHSAINL